ncbi:MAG: hypothetical protein JW993_03050 [Sedimentisphaerales bacterium]|nr:hypothetical protein [Sedimentisphaerales bacterium]
MIDNINANQVGHILGKTSLSNPDATNRRVQDDTDATLHVSFADLINQAKEPPTADAAAVAEAKELLLSGELTSLENIHSAAKNMLQFGV